MRPFRMVIFNSDCSTIKFWSSCRYDKVQKVGELRICYAGQDFLQRYICFYFQSDLIKILEKNHEIPISIKFLTQLFSISFSSDKNNLKLNDEERLCRSLESMGPTFIKLGQFLATRPDIIGDELSKELENLQDRLPPFSQEKAKEIIKKLTIE